MKLTKHGRLEVIVASSEKLFSPSTCAHTLITLQVLTIYVDFFVLPIEGYDAVLRTQWLKTPGPTSWDFSKLIMKFDHNGKLIQLDGTQAHNSLEKLDLLKLVKSLQEGCCCRFSLLLVKAYTLFNLVKSRQSRQIRRGVG